MRFLGISLRKHEIKEEACISTINLKQIAMFAILSTEHNDRCLFLVPKAMKNC